MKQKIVPYKNLFLKDFLLIPKIVHTPEKYEFINKFISSADDSTHVLIRNDQDENTDHPKIET